MKHYNKRKSAFTALLTGALCVLLSTPVVAQEDELKNMPGYIDFGDLAETYGEPKVSINIGGTLLQFVGLMSEESNPETSEMMSNLKGVRVQIFEIGEDMTAAREKFADVKRQLQSAGWEAVIQINEDDEQVLMFLKMNGQKMDGMTVMVVDEEEVVFVNIIGQIDPSQLGKVMDSFDVDIDGALEMD